MKREQSKKLVADFFEHFSGADVERALGLLHPDVVWRVMGREGGLPVSGEMDRHAIGELISGVRELIPGGLRLTPTGWTVEGERVALEMESYGEMVGGRVYNNFYHFLVTVSEGQITTLREYMDTQQVKRLFLDG